MQVDGSQEYWISERSCRLEGSEASTMNDDYDDEQSRRCKQHLHSLTFDVQPAPGSLFSPCGTAALQTNAGSSPRHTVGGVPYSVTCPCRFVQDSSVDHVQPHSEVPHSGETVTSSPTASVRRQADQSSDTPRPQSCSQAPSSAVFEISSYIIAHSASNTSVRPASAAQCQPRPSSHV